MHRRTDSSSSEASSHASHASHPSLDSEPEDQFVLSPSHTPAHENPPPRVMASSYIPDDLLLLGKGTSFSWPCLLSFFVVDVTWLATLSPDE